MPERIAHLNHSEIVRAMRPLQREAAEILIQDVLMGSPPLSITDALAKYSDQLGASKLFDNQKGWAGDIREAAIFCLIQNGFVKAQAVKISKEDGLLTDWLTDEEKLFDAAALEYEYGGNTRLIKVRKRSSAQAKFVGAGEQSVYVYTDSVLDSYGAILCKIGKHNSSEKSSVLGRIFSQYGTGNPGHPVLRLVVRTENAAKLEAVLHRKFAAERVRDVPGTEWFEMDPAQVEAFAMFDACN